MRIAIIAPSIAPALGGIADYSERLGGELMTRGHTVLLLGVNEFHEGAVECDDLRAGMKAVNLSAFRPWEERRRRIKEIVGEFQPEAMTIQYHWHGFWARGGHSRLSRCLAALGRNCGRHIMYHETWESTHASAKLPSWLHRWRIAAQLASMHMHFQPHATWTNSQHHARQLARLFIKAQVEPVASNIPVLARDREAEEALWKTIRTLGAIEQLRQETWIGVLFGRIPPTWCVENARPWIEQLFQQSGRERGLLVSVGNIGYQERGWMRMSELMKKNFTCIKLGLQPATTISRLLALSDVGIVSTPAALLEKSGTAAAMLEHGLPILITDVGRLPSGWHTDNVILAGSAFGRTAAQAHRREPSSCRWKKIAIAYEEALLDSMNK